MLGINTVLFKMNLHSARVPTGGSCNHVKGWSSFLLTQPVGIVAEMLFHKSRCLAINEIRTEIYERCNTKLGIASLNDR
jgi:hypothetical protein